MQENVNRLEIPNILTCQRTSLCHESHSSLSRSDHPKRSRVDKRGNSLNGATFERFILIVQFCISLKTD